MAGAMNGAACLSFACSIAAACAAPAAAQNGAADVAYVQSVNGRVVAFAQAKPVLLEPLDMIEDGTRLDLQKNSELQICHYRTQQVLGLTGPSRASVSGTGLASETGKPPAAAAGRCVAPVVSRFQGGLLARGVVMQSIDVPLRPVVKVANRSKVPVSRISLWNGDEQNAIETFDRQAARPILEDGRAYVLVVQRADGSELKMMLKAGAARRTGPIIVVIQ
ncbi:MAG TPA: hypothetical protein VGF60_22340 [Xanthobacteraceae bacterium]